MRKLFSAFTVIGLLTGSLLISSCQKEYNTTVPDGVQNPPNTMRGTFKCYINGVFYQSELQTAQINEVDGVRSLVITALDYDDTRRKEDFRSFQIMLSYYEGPKEYPVSFTNKASYTRSFTDEGTTLMGYNPVDPEALIIITEDGPNIKGTFNFKIKASVSAPEELVITGGEFDIPRI